MIKCDLTAISNHAVDKLHLRGVEHDTAVTFCQCFFLIIRQCGNHTVIDVIFMQRDDCQTPACRTEILGERINA